MGGNPVSHSKSTAFCYSSCSQLLSVLQFLVFKIAVFVRGSYTNDCKALILQIVLESHMCFPVLPGKMVKLIEKRE